jgi:hypothetical protein
MVIEFEMIGRLFYDFNLVRLKKTICLLAIIDND